MNNRHLECMQAPCYRTLLAVIEFTLVFPALHSTIQCYSAFFWHSDVFLAASQINLCLSKLSSVNGSITFHLCVKKEYYLSSNIDISQVLCFYLNIHSAEMVKCSCSNSHPFIQCFTSQNFSYLFSSII